MLKRIILFFLTLLLCINFCSCDVLYSLLPQETKPYKPLDSNSKNLLTIDKTQQDKDIVLSPHYSSIAIKNAFNTLENQSQKLLYLAIEQYSTVFLKDKNEQGFYTSPIFTVDGCILTDKEVVMVYEAFVEDNPQIFWISNWYAFSVNEGNVQFQLYYLFSEKQYNKKRQQLNAVVNDILADLKGNMSQLELELYFHDYIVKNCIYDKSAVKDETHISFSVYGALVAQKAVCQGYTEAFQMLLSYVGINSYRIVGKSQGANHIWNVVEIDGEKYYVDVTWDDTKDYCMYDYFNITSAQLLKDHTIAKMYKDCSYSEVKGENSINFNLLSAECTATKYNYYRMNASKLNSFEENTFTEDLIKLGNKGEMFFHIYVNPDFATVDKAYEEYFTQGSYKFAKYIKEANKELKDVELDTSAYISKKPKINVITVELKYVNE